MSRLSNLKVLIDPAFDVIRGVLVVADSRSILLLIRPLAAYVGGFRDGASIELHMLIYYPKRVRAIVK